MKKSTKWILGIGGVGAAGGLGYWIYRKRTSPTVTTANAVAAPSFLSQPAPAQYSQSELGMTPQLIGPGTGNQPNGQYTLSAQFTAPVTGTYALQVGADDLATIFIDGHSVLSVSLANTMAQGKLETGTLSLAAGTHTLVAQVWNTNGATPPIAYGSGTPNPTGLVLTLTSPTGQTILTTTSASGWHYSGYNKSGS